jgi:hypothetical protein
MPASGSGNSSEEVARLIKQFVQMVVPRVHLSTYQFIGKIGRQLAKSVSPRARGLLQALEFIDRHQHMSPAATVSNRDRGFKRGVLDLSQPLLEFLRAKFLKYSHISPQLLEIHDLRNSHIRNNQLRFSSLVSSFFSYFPSILCKNFKARPRTLHLVGTLVNLLWKGFET